MYRAVFEFISENLLEWIFMAVTAAGLGYKKALKHQRAEADRNNALCAGVSALLRDRIIQGYNEYSEKGCCPIYAKDNMKRLYKPYSQLAADDVVSELVTRVLKMPTEN